MLWWRSPTTDDVWNPVHSRLVRRSHGPGRFEVKIQISGRAGVRVKFCTCRLLQF